MRHIAFISLMAVVFVHPAISQARLPDARMHSLVLQGIDLTWQEKYMAADSVFQCVIREFPEHPAGYVYKAGVVLSRAMNNEMEVDRAQFDSLIDAGKRKANRLIDAGGDRPWGYFFLGTSDGSDSYARVYAGDWFGGTRKGFAAVSSFKDALKIDSSLCDAEAGIGAFYYWRSRKTEFFNWIPFVGDDRPEAFAMLEQSVEKGIYNRFTALSMSVAIYTDAEMYEKAVRCCLEGLKKYPGNRTFLWGLATALHKSAQWLDAAQTYRRLLDVIVQSQDNNHYNEIVCRLNLAKVRSELRDSSEVLELLTGVVKFSESDFPKHLRGRVQDKIEQAEAMLRAYGNGQSSTGRQ